MTPQDYGREAATKFNANNPGHFPGRPLFEGLVANAVQSAVHQEREAWLNALVVDETGSGSWQERAFGPWRCLLTGERFRTRIEAVEAALVAAKFLRKRT